MRLITAAVAALVVSLAAPAFATADTGAITNVSDNGDGTMRASYSATADCAGDPSGFCFWFPYAVEVAAEQACDPNSQNVAYVGAQGVNEGPGTETGSDTFYPAYTPSHLCLYISYGEGSEVLVAQTTTGTTTPPDEPVAVPPMTVREGKSYVPGILKKKYGRRFNRHTLKRSCFRYTTEKVRCRVSWRKRQFKYSGRVTMWNDPDDPANRFIYTYKIKRKRTHKPHHHSSGAGANCDPNYSGCLNPNASDYDCAGGSGNGPYYTGPVQVIGNDHFDLDRDGDGVACESSGYSASVSAHRQVAAGRAGKLAAIRSGVEVRRR